MVEEGLPNPRRKAVERDTWLRRLAAYAFVRVGCWSIGRGLHLLPPEHPYRILHGSVHGRLVARVSQLPWWGILPLASEPQAREKGRRLLRPLARLLGI